jgi:probable F420-dependent oxidoreductase
MRIGFALPQIAGLGGPENVEKVTRRAEELGYDSLWVLDRLLAPVKPRAPYPASADGSLPAQYRSVLDPVGTLTFAAAHSKRIALGTSILNLPWYNAALLARQLTTLDVLSGGRLRVGFGIGWSTDEYEAAESPWNQRGKRADELVQALKTIWTTDPVEFNGKYTKIAKSYISLKPVQKPHPPIFMAAYTPGAMQRTAREANGWMPVGVPIAAVGQMYDGIKQMAKEAGRDPAKLELLVRANVEFASKPIEKDRPDFIGTAEQIAGDIAAVRKLGASEIIFDVHFSPDVKDGAAMLAKLEQLGKMARAD